MQICLIIIVNVTSSDLFVVTSQVTMFQYLHIRIMPLLLSGDLLMMSPVQHEQLPGGQSGIILKRTNRSPASRIIRPMAARLQILSIPVCAGQNTKPARNIETLPWKHVAPGYSRCYEDQTCLETRLFRNIPDMSQWQTRDQKNPPNSSHSEQDSTEHYYTACQQPCPGL